MRWGKAADKRERSRGGDRNTHTGTPKHERPRILLVDVEGDSESVLSKEGYQVVSGSFGTAYTVEPKDACVRVEAGASLPGYTEQDIIVVDLLAPEAAVGPPPEPRVSKGEAGCWASCSAGVVDLRPLAMYAARGPFDRVLDHGGVFVVFAEPRTSADIGWGRADGYYGLQAQPLGLDNWGFLTTLGSHRIGVTRDHGREMTVLRPGSAIERLLSKALRRARFTCVLESKSSSVDWLPLAQSRYGDTVAAAIGVQADETRHLGFVLIVPQLEDKASFLLELIRDILPDISSHLFPDVEGGRWVQRPEYELPAVLELKARIQQIQEDSRAQIAELEAAVEREREEGWHLHALLTATDDKLVRAVRECLGCLGFRSVVDVDADSGRAGGRQRKREDLQITDGTPLLVVEVKGIKGLPTDSDALQVHSYVTPRMRALKRPDVQGLAIINHQRHVPALERDNAAPFSDDVIANAEDQSFGLMTTWDLHRLVRGLLDNGWQHDHVRGVFYRTGRINPIPCHYEFVGRVERFMETIGVVGVAVEGAALHLGDRIAFELPATFREHVIESMELDNQRVAEAPAGTLVGVKTTLTKAEARTGIRVFKATSPGEVE